MDPYKTPEEQGLIHYITLEYQIEDHENHMLKRFNMIRAIHDQWIKQMGWDEFEGWKKLEWKKE